MEAGPEEPQADPSTLAQMTKYFPVSINFPGPTNAGHHSPSGSELAVKAWQSQITFIPGEYSNGEV